MREEKEMLNFFVALPLVFSRLFSSHYYFFRCKSRGVFFLIWIEKLVLHLGRFSLTDNDVKKCNARAAVTQPMSLAWM